MNTYRYEIKFIVPGQFSHTIDHAIKLNPAMFTKIYEPRYINNIYFDNNLTKYMENIVKYIISRFLSTALRMRRPPAPPPPMEDNDDTGK